MRAIRAGDFAAEARRREYLSRIREPVRIEGAAKTTHHGEVFLAEHELHRARLVGADTMLAGDRAAGLDAELENLRRERLGALGLAVDATVVEHEWMQIAVARMKDIAHAEPVLHRQRVDLSQDERQLRPGYDTVLHVVIGADAAHRREGSLASAPDRGAIDRVRGDPKLARTRLRAERLDAPEILLYLRERPVEVDDEDGAAARRIVRADRSLRSLDRHCVHHLDRRREDAAGDDRGYRAPRVVCVAKTGEERPRGFG